MKTKQTHTSGPYLTLAKESYRAEKTACGCYLWDDTRAPGGRGSDVQYFQCSLHAAAPDLLEAAKQAKEELNRLGGDYDVLRVLRAAIEKAEGGK